MKTYKLSSSVRKRINQTILKYMDYDIVETDYGFTAKFVCFSDREKETVTKEGFLIQ